MVSQTKNVDLVAAGPMPKRALKALKCSETPPPPPPPQIYNMKLLKLFVRLKKKGKREKRFNMAEKIFLTFPIAIGA